MNPEHKKQEDKENEKKWPDFKIIPTFTVGVIVSFCLVGLIFFTFNFVDKARVEKKEIKLKQTQQIEAERNKPQWAYCWSDPTNNESLCGQVTKLRIEKEKVVEFIVYFQETGVTTSFWCIPIKTIGEYSQPGEIGTWFLKRINPNKYVGWLKDDRGRKGISVLEIVKRI